MGHLLEPDDESDRAGSLDGGNGQRETPSPPFATLAISLACIDRFTGRQCVRTDHVSLLWTGHASDLTHVVGMQHERDFPESGDRYGSAIDSGHHLQSFPPPRPACC